VTKKEQFTIIYRQQHAKVFRICRGFFNGDVATAHDTTQEVFIKVWQHLDGFRNESAISTWIYRISVNCCLLHTRKQSVRKEIRVREMPEIAKEEVDLVTEERLDKMYGCIGQLGETDKLVILLVLEGVKYPEIAGVVGISEDTLRVRIHRIKKSLANCVKL
jgi:RNA polymerase sigma factor (sigma-70 family)